MTRLPLYSLNARWESSENERRAGISFDCPCCHRDPHRIHLQLEQDGFWQPVYRHNSETITAISISPTIVGKIYSRFCSFRGWVKLGNVEFIDANTKRVTFWTDIPNDHKAGDF